MSIVVEASISLFDFELGCDLYKAAKKGFRNRLSGVTGWLNLAQQRNEKDSH
jgi:hypothetical protein